MPDNTNKTYYIDQTVLTYLLKITDPKEAEDAYTLYLGELNNAIEATINSYINEANMPDEQKRSIKALLSNTLLNKDVDTQLNKAPDYLTEKQLEDPKLQQKIQATINTINQQLYLDYKDKLTPEEKEKLNAYLKSMEETIKLDMQNTIDVIKLLEEYEKVKAKADKQATTVPTGPLEGTEKTNQESAQEPIKPVEATSPITTPAQVSNPVQVSKPAPQLIQPQTQGMPAFNPNQVETTVQKDPIFSEPVTASAPQPQPQIDKINSSPMPIPSPIPTPQPTAPAPQAAANQQSDQPAINLTSL